MADYQPPNFDDLYGAYNKTNNATATKPAVPTNPMAALLMQLLAPQPAQAFGGTDLSALLRTLAQTKDPQGYANKLSSMPSYMPGSMSPFNTGFFKTRPQRQQVELSRFPGAPY